MNMFIDQLCMKMMNKLMHSDLCTHIVPKYVHDEQSLELLPPPQRVNKLCKEVVNTCTFAVLTQEITVQ